MSIDTSTDPPGEVQRAFDRARRTVEEQMTPKQLKRFGEISSLDHLIGEAQRVGKVLKTKRKSNRVRKLALGIDPYARIVEGVCKVAPLGGDLIWGVVSFILDMAKGDTDVVEEVLGFLKGMAEEIEHLGMAEETFRKSRIVAQAVEAVYVAIVTFWVTALEYYMKKLEQDIISRLKRRFTSSRVMLSDFAALKNKIAAQKSRLHEVEATQHYANEQNDRVLRQKKDLLDFIDPPDYERFFRAAKSYRHNGTCEWLRGRQEYVDWIQVYSRSFLVIYGTAGAGKTVLSSWLIDEAQSRPTQHVTLYHYFKETDDSCNTALAATRSLLHQIYSILLSSNHTLLSTLESELQAMSLKKHVHFEALWELLSPLLSKYSQSSHLDNSPAVTIVLDAMDECKDSNQLVQNLRKLVHTALNKIHVVVTGRQSGDHVDEFRHEYADQAWPIILEVTQSDVTNDIVAFVAHSIKRIERLDYPKHHNLRDRVITTFSDVKNHEGMFLWAYFMCKEVECQFHVADIWSLLKHLPKGLEGMYARICKRLSEANETNRKFSRQVLEWIVVSRRPMTFIELEEALKVTTDRGTGSSSIFFDEDGGLLWSRRDIVRCCGDLVRYTGLAEGDTIGIIHLSAQQFLSDYPSNFSTDIASVVEPYVMDVPRLEFKMGMTCINYMLSTASHADEYFSPPAPLDLARTPGQNAFKQRYPLLDYSVVYLMQYVLNTVQHHPDIGPIHQLLVIIAEFTQSPVSVIWLEELIRLMYLEYVEDAIRRFIALQQDFLLPDTLRWFNLVTSVLRDFPTTLRSHPWMLQSCILHRSHSPVEDIAPLSDVIPPLDGERIRDWVHYDPILDTIFSITSFPRVSLKSQIMTTGVRSRPVSLPLEGSQPNISWSATTSASGSRFAITFTAELSDGMSYVTTCWDINNLSNTSSDDNWATLIFTSTYSNEGSKTWDYGGQTAVFGKSETIITPGGIFSLHTKHCIDRLSGIYNPDFTHKISDIRLSRDGERVARIRDSRLEVLNINGTSIYEHRFDDLFEVGLYGFSDTGEKVVIAFELREENVISRQITKLFCALVNEAKQIEMSMPSHWIQKENTAFTPDEMRFVAFVTNYKITETSETSRVAVWTFLKDGDGPYHEHAELIYIFDSPQFVRLVFCLIPGPVKDSVDDALIVEEDRRITRRPLNAQYIPDMEEVYRRDWVFSSQSGELAIWSIRRNGNLTVEIWSLKSMQPNRISHYTEPAMPIPNNRLFKASPCGNYLAYGGAIVDGHEPTNFGVSVLDLPGEMRGCAFSIDESRFACIFDNGDKSMLYVFDLSQGPKYTLQASCALDTLGYPWFFFSKFNPTLLAVGKYLMRLENHHLIVQAELNDVMRGFSGCGLYYYDRELQLHGLPDDLIPETSPPMEIGFLMPYWYNWYIYPPHKFGLLRKFGTGIINLTHELIGSNTRRARVIWVLPDAIPEASILLMWPEGDTDNLKLLIMGNDRPVLVDTGIKKGELMKDVEWVEIDDSYFCW